MEVKDVIREKENLEDMIYEIVFEFEKLTGTRVVDIHVRRMNIDTIDSEKHDKNIVSEIVSEVVL